MVFLAPVTSREVVKKNYDKYETVFSVQYEISYYIYLPK